MSFWVILWTCDISDRTAIHARYGNPLTVKTDNGPQFIPVIHRISLLSCKTIVFYTTAQNLCGHKAIGKSKDIIGPS